MWFLSLGNWEYSNLLEGKYKVYMLLSIMLHILWIWRFSSTIKKKRRRKENEDFHTSNFGVQECWINLCKSFGFLVSQVFFWNFILFCEINIFLSVIHVFYQCPSGGAEIVIKHIQTRKPRIVSMLTKIIGRFLHSLGIHMHVGESKEEGHV